MSRSRKRNLLLAAALAAVALIVLSGIGASGEASLERGMEISRTAEDTVDPEFDLPESRVTEAERAAAKQWLEQLKERVQSRYPTSVPGPEVDLPDLEPVAATGIGRFGDSEFHGAPESLKRRNRRNTQANLQSTLAEPVAIATGDHILAGGNTHYEYSTNGGSTWTNISIPAGPSYAPIDCCDPDVQHFPGRGVTVYAILYLDAPRTRGAVRLFVRRSVPAGYNCSYTFNYGRGVVPDYPHLGRSNDYLYLSTNNIGTGGWTGSQMKRIELDKLVDCVATGVRTYTYTGAVGQRVFVPTEGATEEMFWLTNENTTQSRIFRWKESSTSVQSWLRSRSTSTFSNPDCRGGTNNYDWIERSTAWSITGFRVRSAIRKGRYLCSFWNVGPDASHPQGHVHAVCYDVVDRGSPSNAVAQPHIWHGSGCYGFPAVSSNSRGDLGLSIGFGGKAGGGGNAAQGYVGVDDDFTNGVFFGPVYKTASGTTNRSDGRHGDYYTVRPNFPCDLGFVATNYSLLSSSRNVRVVRYSRGRDWRCMLEWQRKPHPTYDD